MYYNVCSVRAVKVSGPDLRSRGDFLSGSHFIHICFILFQMSYAVSEEKEMTK